MITYLLSILFVGSSISLMFCFTLISEGVRAFLYTSYWVCFACFIISWAMRQHGIILELTPLTNAERLTTIYRIIVAGVMSQSAGNFFIGVYNYTDSVVSVLMLVAGATGLISSLIYILPEKPKRPEPIINLHIPRIMKPAESEAVIRDCPICLEEGASYQTACSHAYHYSCIKKWVEHGNATCPDCRKSIVY